MGSAEDAIKKAEELFKKHTELSASQATLTRTVEGYNPLLKMDAEILNENKQKNK